MRKYLVLALAGLLLMPACLCAKDDFKGRKNASIEAPEKNLRVRERLVYRVEWLGIYVGKIALENTGIEKIFDKECYHIKASARPNRVIAKFYNVEYLVDTYIDIKTNHTVRFKKERRINGKTHYTEIDFDRQKKEVVYKEFGQAPTALLAGNKPAPEPPTTATLKILNGTQDLFSSLYYVRTLEVEENQSYSVDIYYHQRNWPLKVRVGKPFQRDIRKQGSFVVFEASLDSALGSFILGKSKMSVLFTADPRRIPVEFKFSTGTGPIRGMIESITY